MPFTTTSDGVELFYSDWGSGRPVVLVHGFPGNSSMWEYQAVPLVEAGFRVITPDRRGFGRSARPFDGYDYDTFSDDLAAVFEALQLDDAVLVGFSMGVGDVVRYFSRHAGKGVAKAIMVSGTPPYLLKTDDNPDGADGSMFDAMVDNARKDRPAFLANFAKGFFGLGGDGPPVSDETVRQFVVDAAGASPKATIGCIEAFARTDFRDDLAVVYVPTLVIHGGADEAAPIEITSRKTAASIGHAELKIYDDAPHALYFTHKDKLTADIIAFART